jgi:isoleucyl-tRNA synthetase
MAPLTPFVTEELFRNLSTGNREDGPDSVHLTDFPTADADLLDPELDEAMAIVRAIVSLGRQVRTDAKVRVRQPLPRAVLHVTGDPARLEPMLDLAAEELNVKQIAFAESAEEFSGWRAKPNFRELGPRLGQRVQDVARALAADDGELGGRLASGESVTVDAAGETITLSSSDVELSQQTRSGWGVASDGSVTVALDLDLEGWPALQREGMVREVIHHVQNLRKAAGLNVADRIELRIETDPSERLGYALSTHASLIQGEVLATELEVAGAAADVRDWDRSVTVEIDGVPATLLLRRA